MKQLSYRNFRTLLLANGYEVLRTRGDHVIYGKEGNIVVINKRNPNQMVMRRLIKENSISV